MWLHSQKHTCTGDTTLVLAVSTTDTCNPESVSDWSCPARMEERSQVRTTGTRMERQMVPRRSRHLCRLCPPVLNFSLLSTSTLLTSAAHRAGRKGGGCAMGLRVPSKFVLKFNFHLGSRWEAGLLNGELGRFHKWIYLSSGLVSWTVASLKAQSPSPPSSPLLISLSSLSLVLSFFLSSLHPPPPPAHVQLLAPSASLQCDIKALITFSPPTLKSPASQSMSRSFLFFLNCPAPKLQHGITEVGAAGSLHTETVRPCSSGILWRKQVLLTHCP